MESPQLFLKNNIFNPFLVFDLNQIGSPSIVFLLYLHAQIKELCLGSLSNFLPAHKLFQLGSFKTSELFWTAVQYNH